MKPISRPAFLFFAALFTVLSMTALSQLKAPGVKWDDTYQFDKCNQFKVEFYARNNELMRTLIYKIHYQTGGDNFIVRLITGKPGTDMETILDKKNEVGIQIMGAGPGAEPFYNTGGYRFPAGEELKKLDLAATPETKQILGFTCKKYTYTYKKIFGEVWITDQVELTNDIGIFRAAKMAALHNTLSVGGFVMEMTSEDAKGGKTVMMTTSLENDEQYLVDLSKVKMNTAINKVSYFVF